jgi:hypothetical protein
LRIGEARIRRDVGEIARGLLSPLLRVARFRGDAFFEPIERFEGALGESVVGVRFDLFEARGHFGGEFGFEFDLLLKRAQLFLDALDRSRRDRRRRTDDDARRIDPQREGAEGGGRQHGFQRARDATARRLCECFGEVFSRALRPRTGAELALGDDHAACAAVDVEPRRCTGDARHGAPREPPGRQRRHSGESEPPGRARAIPGRRNAQREHHGARSEQDRGEMNADALEPRADQRAPAHGDQRSFERRKHGRHPNDERSESRTAGRRARSEARSEARSAGDCRDAR